MGKTIYEKAIKSLSIYQQILADMINKKPINRNDITGSLDVYKNTSEFDLLKIEYPETHPILLKHLLNNYEQINYSHEHLFRTDITNNEDKEEDYSKPYENDPYFFYFSKCLNHIIFYLKGLLNTDNKIQEPPTPTLKPRGETILNREQTALLFWYLREKNFIAPRVLNQDLAKAIEIMTPYNDGSIAKVLKMPNTDVSKLGKEHKKVTYNDFKSVINQLKILIEKIEFDLKNNPSIEK